MSAGRIGSSGSNQGSQKRVEDVVNVAISAVTRTAARSASGEPCKAHRVEIPIDILHAAIIESLLAGFHNLLTACIDFALQCLAQQFLESILKINRQFRKAIAAELLLFRPRSIHAR